MEINTHKQILQELVLQSTDLGIEKSKRFFKVGKGSYSEHDEFLGISIPALRVFSKKYRDCTFSEISQLFRSKFHEARMLAILILIEKYSHSISTVKKADCIHCYVESLEYCNNWDLVDASAYKLLGDSLIKTPRTLLYTFAKDSNMWKRRIAIVSTFSFIRIGELDDTFAIAEVLLSDTEDLMHKAVGWMLREAGKRDHLRLTKFLENHISSIPRTTLRYAIEKFSKEERVRILKLPRY